jgi:hypothetical protein
MDGQIKKDVVFVTFWLIVLKGWFFFFVIGGYF